MSSLPAFVAAPNAAQPLTEGASPAESSQSQSLTGEGNKPAIESHPQPQGNLKPQERNPQLDMDTDQPANSKNTDPVTSSSVGIAVAGNVGVQTVWPPSASGEDTDESGGGFGYATVKPVGHATVKPVGHATVKPVGHSPPKDSDEPLRPLPEVPALHVHETASGMGNTSKSHRSDTVHFSDDELYTKVKKSSHKKAGLGASVGLPPRIPSQSEQTKRENSPIFQIRTKQRESTRHDPKNTGEITPSPTEQGRRRQARNKIDSTLVYHFDDGLAGETEKRASWEGAEYTDEEYIPSGDDTFSITETNFSEEDLILHSDLPPHNSKRDQAKHRRSSLYGYRSATPSGRQTKRARSSQYLHRPSSAPQPNLDNIPFIRPSFIQQLPSTHPQSQLGTTDGEVYIFSEAQGDGSVQYYTATPVHTPTRTGQASYQTPLIQQPATPTLLGPHFIEPRHYPSTPVMTNPVQPQQQPANPMQPQQYASPVQPQQHASLVQPQQYASPVQPQQYTSAVNQQYTPPANPVQPQQYTLSASGRDSMLKGTKITKLGGPVSQNSLRDSPPVPSGAKGSGLDQTDANFSAESPRGSTGIAKPLLSSHSMSRDQDKIRSLTVTLDQQLVSEQRYLKLKEVSY